MLQLFPLDLTLCSLNAGTILCSGLKNKQSEPLNAVKAARPQALLIASNFRITKK